MNDLVQLQLYISQLIKYGEVRIAPTSSKGSKTKIIKEAPSLDFLKKYHSSNDVLFVKLNNVWVTLCTNFEFDEVNEVSIIAYHLND